jgi:hypothetical protein
MSGNSVCALKASQCCNKTVIDKPILSSETLLRENYDRMGSVAKKQISGREPQGAWLKDELLGGKPPVVK